MSKAIETKSVHVQEITAKLQAAASVVVVDYRGLNVAQVTELRKQLREAGVEFKVYKNTLTRRAAEIAGVEAINEVCKNLKAIKAFLVEDYLWIAIEMFTDSTPELDDFMPRCMQILKTGREMLAEEIFKD